jgi:hypothetical protein
MIKTGRYKEFIEVLCRRWTERVEYMEGMEERESGIG